MGDPSRVRVRGPLEPFALGSAAWLEQVGYTQNSAGGQLRLMAHASRWLETQDLDVGAPGDVVERFAGERRAAGYTNYVTVRALAPLLGYLRGIGAMREALAVEPATPADVLLGRYRRYLTVERGLVAGTCGGRTASGDRSGSAPPPGPDDRDLRES